MVVCSCTTRRIISGNRPDARDYLFVVKSEEDVTLSWESRPDKIYTIKYKDRIDSPAPWTVLPGAEMVQGTGASMMMRDRIPLNGTRVYDLVIQPSTGRPRGTLPRAAGAASP